MKVTVVSASTKTGAATITHLLSASTAPRDLAVVGLYRDPSKAPAKFRKDSRFQARKGNLANADTLDLAGSDAVVVVIPPLLEVEDGVAESKKMAEAVHKAVQRDGVKRVVYISSMGAEFSEGTGVILTNHVAERALKDAAPEVAFIRNCYFMENWLWGAEDIKREDGAVVHSTLCPIHYKIPMISVIDVGKCAANLALQTDTPLPHPSPYIFDLEGPKNYSAEDARDAFEKALGRPSGQIQVEVIPPTEVETFFAHTLPPKAAQSLAVANWLMLEGGKLSPQIHKPPAGGLKRGGTTLEEALKAAL